MAVYWWVALAEDVGMARGARIRAMEAVLAVLSGDAASIYRRKTITYNEAIETRAERSRAEDSREQAVESATRVLMKGVF